MDLYEKTRFLTRRKFPDYRQLREPYDGNNADLIARKGLFEAFTKQLANMPLQELDMLCIEQMRQEQLEQDEEARRSDQLAFFSRPDAEADFKYWDSLEKWKIEEANALLLGKDPFKVRWEEVRNYRFISALVTEYLNLRSQLLRAQADDKLAENDTPDKFKSWAIETGQTLPPALVAVPKPAKMPTSDVSTKERHKMLTIIVAMATKKYGYSFQTRNNAAKSIADHATELGLSINDDTVRNYLKEAAELLEENRT